MIDTIWKVKMLMGKARTDRYGYSREQKLLKENKELRREVQGLRKRLARIELNRYEQVRETIEEHRKDDILPTTEDLLEKLKQEWACKKCSNGYLEIIIFNKLSDTFYLRKCNSCDNRTRSQRYDAKIVKGIVKNKNEL